MPSMTAMNDWTTTNWRPTPERLPTASDGVLFNDNVKVLVMVLTKRAILEGDEPEIRGFHLKAKVFDDDEGIDTVMFWAPCRDKSLRQRYAGRLLEPAK